MEIEQLAKDYHEICREMVDRQIRMITKPTKPYIEWDELTEDQKTGRRFIAEKLLEKFWMKEKDLSGTTSSTVEFLMNGGTGWNNCKFEFSDEDKAIRKKLNEVKLKILDTINDSLIDRPTFANLKVITQIIIDLNL